jgi:hypothetical protein
MRPARATLALAAAAALGLLAVAPTQALPSPSTGTTARATTPTSAVTEQGSGRFSGLSVTVSQTQHLVNQVVTVSWKGFGETTPRSGSFDTNYLQIMQCWGDGDTPRRENCQYGGQYRDARGGTWAATRQTTYGSSLVDPDETYVKDPGSFLPKRVPFEPVSGDPTSDVDNQYYDAYSTNEVPFARSSADGTGREFFEVQTAREAPGLGCGERLADGPRSCWLVVVPRDDVEVNGQHVADTEDRRLVSSPLSASNWAHRISFRMDFDPLGLSCPLGSPETRLIGNEMVSEAVARWQPALCEDTGSIYGFSQVGDDLARAQVTGDTPWLSLVSDPVPADRNTDDREVAYAPMAVSGLGIAFVIDRQPFSSAPDAVKARRGTRVESLRLNPRLVAKLLTQSYSLATFDPPGTLGKNPRQLPEDPEFLALNPEFQDLQFNALMSISIPLGLSDANRQLWQYVDSDKDARAFVAGKADPWGMRINPAYKGMSLDREDFPRSDSHCQSFGDGRPDLCTLDYLAFAADMHEAGRGAARGDTLARILWDPAASPPSWKKSPPQLSGQRAVLALVDTAGAARYQLPLASLENAAGKFVAPTSASLTAGLAAMKPSGTPGVLSPDPGAKDPKAYPLTTVTYGVTAPHLIPEDQRKPYAGFVTFAATDGQKPGIEPGDLPEGYVPLSPALRKQALATAALIAKGGSKVTDGGDGTGGASGAGGTGTTGGDGGQPALTPGGSGSSTTDGAATGGGTDAGTAPAATDGPGTTDKASGVTEQTTPVSATPGTPVGLVRLLLPLALLLGAVLALARPARPYVAQLIGRIPRGPRGP